MKNGFDAVASFYDRLSNLLFSNSIRRSQEFLIDAIIPKSKILIIGGGTGWILEALSVKHSEGLEITYVDASAKMIALSKKGNIKNNKVDFVNRSIVDTEFYKQYDVVFTPFFLDLFSHKNVENIILKIDNYLIKDGLWLNADFQIYKNSLWQKIFLKMMYLFFKLTCNIEANYLAETKTMFEKLGYKIVTEKSFYSDFIISKIYRKC